jgi:2Fe-2S ferredoxin
MASVPTIVFEGDVIGREKRIDAPEGGALVDFCDQALAPIPFSCRSATCGTCQIEVIEGLSLLEEAGGAERELLRGVRAGDRDRLGCQARVLPGPGLVRVRAVGL